MKKNILLLISISFLSISMAVNANNIAFTLWKRYNDKTSVCEGNEPAFKCSGLMIRGINQANKLPHAWSIKPESKKKGSFAFGYLRTDQHFSKFPRGYDSGFIIYPHFKTPNKKKTYKVYCAFPVDAHTDGRAGHGCGISESDTSKTSQHCDKQGINSFPKWVNHLNSIMNSRDNNFVTRQCAFDMTLPRSGKDFVIVGKATRFIQLNVPKYYMRNNELLVHAWNEKKPAALPIEAFFYILGSPEGLKYARKYQKDYYKETGGQIVPIVGIELPSVSFAGIYVKFDPRDQAI